MALVLGGFFVFVFMFFVLVSFSSHTTLNDASDGSDATDDDAPALPSVSCNFVQYIFFSARGAVVFVLRAREGGRYFLVERGRAGAGSAYWLLRFCFLFFFVGRERSAARLYPSCALLSYRLARKTYSSRLTTPASVFCERSGVVVVARALARVSQCALERVARASPRKDVAAVAVAVAVLQPET